MYVCIVTYKGKLSKKPEEVWFEDIPAIPEKYLNKYEKKAKFNIEYILNFWDEMAALPLDKHWDIKFDEPEAKCWISKTGSKFSS